MVSGTSRKLRAFGWLEIENNVVKLTYISCKGFRASGLGDSAFKLCGRAST